MKVWPVDSKKTMLSPQDIFAVAAHEDKESLKAFKQAAAKARVSPERLRYATMIQEYSDPRLIRVRSGNTLFTIAALPEGIGFVRGYNADVASNYIHNMLELNKAAARMGFICLLAHVSQAAYSAVKSAIKRSGNKEIKMSYDAEQQLLAISTGKGE